MKVITKTTNMMIINTNLRKVVRKRTKVARMCKLEIKMWIAMSKRVMRKMEIRRKVKAVKRLMMM